MFSVALLHSMSYFFYLYWSTSLPLCMVFNSISSNIDEVLWINPFAMLMTILVMIGTVFVIIWEIFHGRISLNSVLVKLKGFNVNRPLFSVHSNLMCLWDLHNSGVIFFFFGRAEVFEGEARRVYSCCLE